MLRSPLLPAVRRAAAIDSRFDLLYSLAVEKVRTVATLCVIACLAVLFVCLVNTLADFGFPSDTPVFQPK